MKPKKYRFVHSDGTVELFSDTTVAPTENKSQVKSSKYDHKQTSDSEDFLTPSETEPDDSEFMSENPVSLRQVRGLKENEKLRRCQISLSLSLTKSNSIRSRMTSSSSSDESWFSDRVDVGTEWQ